MILPMFWPANKKKHIHKPSNEHTTHCTTSCNTLIELKNRKKTTTKYTHKLLLFPHQFTTIRSVFKWSVNNIHTSNTHVYFVVYCVWNGYCCCTTWNTLGKKEWVRKCNKKKMKIVKKKKWCKQERERQRIDDYGEWSSRKKKHQKEQLIKSDID